MSDNLDFSKIFGTINPTTTSTKLTVYGPQGTIPPNPVRFPNAYLTAPIYDLSNNIVGVNGPKLNIYGSIPETRYPFTYIGTPAINNYGLFGQINQSNAPKISVYQQVQGTLVFSYDYTGNLTLVNLASVTYLPIITGNNALTIVNSNATKNVNKVTVTVNISYIDDGTTFGLSFYTANNYLTTFYNSSVVSNLSITTLTNIPLSRTGNQFANLTNALNSNNIPSLFASKTVIPIILLNTSLIRCFNLSTNFNSDISGWNTTNVNNMSNMFQNATAFNQDISGWNLSKIAPNQFYILTGQLVFTFTCSRTNLFITPNIPLIVNTYFTTTYTISPSLNSGNVMTGIFYTVTCATSYDSNTANTTDFGLSFNNNASFYNTNTTNLSITILKNIPLSKIGSQFRGLSSLNQNNIPSLFASNTVIPQILPNTSFLYCFAESGNFNSDISGWNTTNVTNMSNMFSGFFNLQSTPSLIQHSFNQPINSWNTSNVTNMSNMFFCSIFNQPINSWNTSNVTNMSNMFSGKLIINNNGDVINFKHPFSQPINSWDTSNVTNMYQMFYLSSFNQPINSWNTSNVTNMYQMFSGDSIYYIIFNNYFAIITDFNQNIGSWNTSNVTNMYQMFYGSNFQNGGTNNLNWNGTKLSNINRMFNKMLSSYDNNNDVNVYISSQFNQPMTLTDLNVVGLDYTDWHSGAALTNANAPVQLRNAPYW
jgi:surface protein